MSRRPLPVAEINRTIAMGLVEADLLIQRSAEEDSNVAEAICLPTSSRCY